jgi:hypothetical protein
MPFSSTFTFPMQYKRTRVGQYYSITAVSPDGKVKKQNEPRKDDMFFRKEMEILLKLDEKVYFY